MLQQNKERIVLIKIIFAWQHATYTFAMHGDLAQLVERLHGMQEVTGSTPVFSTNDYQWFRKFSKPFLFCRFKHGLNILWCAPLILDTQLVKFASWFESSLNQILFP